MKPKAPRVITIGTLLEPSGKRRRVTPDDEAGLRVVVRRKYREWAIQQVLWDEKRGLRFHMTPRQLSLNLPTQTEP